MPKIASTTATEATAMRKAATIQDNVLVGQLPTQWTPDANFAYTTADTLTLVISV